MGTAGCMHLVVWSCLLALSAPVPATTNSPATSSKSTAEKKILVENFNFTEHSNGTITFQLVLPKCRGQIKNRALQNRETFTFLKHLASLLNNYTHPDRRCSCCFKSNSTKIGKRGKSNKCGFASAQLVGRTRGPQCYLFIPDDVKGQCDDAGMTSTDKKADNYVSCSMAGWMTRADKGRWTVIYGRSERFFNVFVKKRQSAAVGNTLSMSTVRLPSESLSLPATYLAVEVVSLTLIIVNCIMLVCVLRWCYASRQYGREENVIPTFTPALHHCNWSGSNISRQVEISTDEEYISPAEVRQMKREQKQKRLKIAVSSEL